MKAGIFIAFLFFAAATLAGAGLDANKLATAARSQIGVTTNYDAAYRKLSYPNGDVPKETGVCADVIVRAFRAQNVDLQKEVHEDMKRDFGAYPRKWGLDKPDVNIDHRRVPNLMTYFRRKGYAQPAGEKPDQFAPGDIVAWDLGRGVTHIGFVSDRKDGRGTPLVIHNIGQGTKEENVLLQYRIIGHYRVTGA